MCSEMRSEWKSCRAGLNHGLPRAFVALAGIVLNLGSGQTQAECVEEQKLTASDMAANGRFAVAVSVSGNVALIGASREDCWAGERCGSAYVFRFNGTSWVEEQKLTASDAAADDRFGGRVSISGDVAVVGVIRDGCAAGDFCGSAYVYRFDGSSWFEEQKLTASDAAPDDAFGYSVSVSEDTVLVGALWDDCPAGLGCGSAYVYRFNGWSWVEEQKLIATGAEAAYHLGGFVSLDGNVAVLGARTVDRAAGNNCGSAYVFRFDGLTWVEEQKLIASDAESGDSFGFAVSVSGDTALVGAYMDDCAAASYCGSVYVFRFNGTSWFEEQKLTASDAAYEDVFGAAVSVSGDTAVIGAFGDDCPASSVCGAAYVFRFNRTSWVETQKLSTTDTRTEDLFGASVSVSGDTAVVAAPARPCAAGTRCGAAYVFSCLTAPKVVNLDIKPGSCPNPLNPKSKGVVPVAL
ncbi:MAG: FG-GAP repeat protein, partial [Phycisphaerae bacterium]